MIHKWKENSDFKVEEGKLIERKLDKSNTYEFKTNLTNKEKIVIDCRESKAPFKVNIKTKNDKLTIKVSKPEIIEKSIKDLNGKAKVYIKTLPNKHKPVIVNSIKLEKDTSGITSGKRKSLLVATAGIILALAIIASFHIITTDSPEPISDNIPDGYFLPGAETPEQAFQNHMKSLDNNFQGVYITRNEEDQRRVDFEVDGEKILLNSTDNGVYYDGTIGHYKSGRSKETNKKSYYNVIYGPYSRFYLSSQNNTTTPYDKINSYNMTYDGKDKWNGNTVNVYSGEVVQNHVVEGNQTVELQTYLYGKTMVYQKMTVQATTVEYEITSIGQTSVENPDW